ncbi:MAG: CDGSH iron-sulfur domain-containing protein [Bacteroidia bacterium]|nr:CDGSH iron-sulfur domain-containing protein [Bacteroidia bacterium]
MDSILKVKVVPNGPLMLNGICELEKLDGSTDKREGKTYLCRCGHSDNKPYCDGMHRKVEFQG